MPAEETPLRTAASTQRVITLSVSVTPMVSNSSSSAPNNLGKPLRMLISSNEDCSAKSAFSSAKATAACSFSFSCRSSSISRSRPAMSRTRGPESPNESAQGRQFASGWRQPGEDRNGYRHRPRSGLPSPNQCRLAESRPSFGRILPESRECRLNRLHLTRPVTSSFFPCFQQGSQNQADLSWCLLSSSLCWESIR